MDGKSDLRMLIRGGRGGRDLGERLLQADCSLELYFPWVFLVRVRIADMLYACSEKMDDFGDGFVKPRIRA